MNAVRQTIINIITTRPVSTILAKASHDFIFFSFYILIIGLAVLGIVNLTMRINNRSSRYIAAVNTVLFVLLLLSIALANILFYFIRGH